MNKQESVLSRIVKYLLFTTALTPLIVVSSITFSFAFPKMVFFRSIVELALVVFIIYIVVNLYRHKPIKISVHRRLLKNPLVIALMLFGVSLILSTIFAENVYRAFWGDVERAEGLFGMLHYFAFLGMTLAVFNKKNWITFFKITLGVGAILIFYAFLEYFGISFLFFKKSLSPRPQSLIGNPAFLATHMLFVMTAAGVVFATVRKYLWRYIAVITAFFAVITIFLTGTRGAILGLGTGIVALLVFFMFNKENIFLKRVSGALLILLLVFGGTFWITRSSELWQKIPGLDRLARTEIFDPDDSSTQVRLITWGVSWEAFKERPLFGWGPDNYLFAYEKHYDPDYALYGETWLDRAHNKIFDVLVMQGIVGLLAYMAVFWAIFYLLFRSKYHNPALIRAKPFVIAGLVGYFVQNLVLFDQILSYSMFFAFMGYILKNSTSEYLEIEESLEITQKHRIVLVLTSVVFVPVLLYTLYMYNYVPIVQAKLFKMSPGISENVYDVVQLIQRAMYPYNFAQHNLRGETIDKLYLDQFFYTPKYAGNEKFRPLADILIESMDEIVRREPYDARVFIREVEMLNGLARVMSDDDPERKELFRKGEELMRIAVEIAPNRQEVYYHLALNLAGQEKYEEAIEMAQHAISLSPRLGVAHYQLALMYALAGRNEESQNALAKAEELSPNFERFKSADLKGVALLYNSWNIAEWVLKVAKRTIAGEIGNNMFTREFYDRALLYFMLENNQEGFITIVQFLGKVYNDVDTETVKVLTDLAEKNKWGIIKSLLIVDN